MTPSRPGVPRAAARRRSSTCVGTRAGLVGSRRSDGVVGRPSSPPPCEGVPQDRGHGGVVGGELGRAEERARRHRARAPAGDLLRVGRDTTHRVMAGVAAAARRRGRRGGARTATGCSCPAARGPAAGGDDREDPGARRSVTGVRRSSSRAPSRDGTTGHRRRPPPRAHPRPAMPVRRHRAAPRGAPSAPGSALRRPGEPMTASRSRSSGVTVAVVLAVGGDDA